MLFLDLDHFKEINDTLGHQIGDQLLTETAARLTACLRKEDTVSRHGGDEFVVLIENHGIAQYHLSTAQRIKETLGEPFNIEGHALHVSASIGIAVYPSHGTDPAALIINADMAMYHAKKMGKNNFQIFQADMRK